MNVTAAIYMRGDSLEPGVITRALGVIPTKSHMKGEVTVSRQGRQTHQQTSVWIWTSDPFEGESALEAAAKILSEKFSGDLSLLPGVDEAWIDVLVLKSRGGDVSEMVFSLSSSSCLALGALGLPVYFTVDLIGERT